jgi:hypothetical protein
MGDSYSQPIIRASNEFTWDGQAQQHPHNDKQIIALMKRGFEEFERHILLKVNEEKIRTQGELNLQAEMSIKMMDEFRIRLGELEHMQNKLSASVDILDIRTKGGISGQVPLIG